MSREGTIRFDDAAFISGFAERMVSLRNKAGISQHALSKRAGITRSTIAMIETGRQHPTLVQAGRIASGLGVSTRELLGF